MKKKVLAGGLGIVAVALVIIGVGSPLDETSSPVSQQTASYIVQGSDVDAVAALVAGTGGAITHRLGVISAVGADLTPSQADALRGAPGIRRLYDNGAVEVAGKPVKSGGTGGVALLDTHFPTIVNADDVHNMGITGAGIGIAVLDTGLWKHDGLRYDRSGSTRLKALYDAITDTESSPNSGSDEAGHGTHIASIAVSSLIDANGRYNGVAPDAHLVSVRAFGPDGQGTYADVVRAIDWVIANRAKHKIRILNLSFTATVRSHYWDDPINQAVMAAWQKEIFVVAAAGNSGPGAMTIGVPGNVPYIMTVGAMTDNYTPADGSDDIVATFSSAGPTIEGFVKPDLVAPGGHMLGLQPGDSMLAQNYPEFYVNDLYFEMSGTSQATAVVSGVAALALQAEPWRSVDELKCKLISAARPAVTGSGNKTELAYSIFQQGAGLVDAAAAVSNQRVDCANIGLHIDNDLDGYQHFGGRANVDADGNYYLMGVDGFLWTDETAGANGFLWTEGFLWTDETAGMNGFLWTEGYLWTDETAGMNGFLWTDGSLWTEGYLWTDGDAWIDGYLWTDGESGMASMSGWVNPE